MSNKMLTKRLLAAGMSVAMSATLFATNSITIFAEEGEAPVEAIAAPGVPSGEPAAPAEISIPEPVETTTVVVEEYDDYIAITTTETTDYYRSDMNSKDFEGEQADYYLPVNAEDTAGQTLDYTDTLTDYKYDIEGSVVLKDSEGEIVTVPTEDGKEVILELDPNFDIEEDAELVNVIEDKDGNLEIVDEDEKVFYGYFDEDGNFVEDEDGEAYVLRSGDNYELLGTAYTTVDANGEKIILDEEVYKALKGEESIYTPEKQYDYTTSHYDHRKHKWVDETNAYSAEDLAKKQDVLEVDDERWNYTLNRESTAATLPYQEVEYYKAVVERYNFNHEPVARFYFVAEDGKTYYNEKIVPWWFKPGDTVEINEYNKNDHVGRYSDTYAATETVYIRVFDKEGKLIFECDKTAYDNLKAENFVKVAGEKIAVQDKDENTVLLDVDDYTQIFALHDHAEVTNVYYYTVQDKYEKDPMVVNLEMDDKEYELTVAFWENNRIGAQYVEVFDNNNETLDVVVYFAYADYEYDWWRGKYVSTTSYDSKTFTVNKSIFGKDGTARMEIKYTPSYNGEAYKYHVRELLRATDLDNPFVTGQLIVLAAAERGDIVLDQPEYEGEEPTFLGYDWTEYEPGRIRRIRRGFDYSVDLGEPVMTPSNNDVPAPPTEEEEDYTPGTPSTDVTPVFFTTLAAPAGQVLGEQRPLAADGAAVLGASRARGTADETTAPIARVLVMAAVASAALFLTRKREENN